MEEAVQHMQTHPSVANQREHLLVQVQQALQYVRSLRLPESNSDSGSDPSRLSQRRCARPAAG